MMYFWGWSTDKDYYMSKASSKVRFNYLIQIEKPFKVKICEIIYIPFRIWDPFFGDEAVSK